MATVFAPAHRRLLSSMPHNLAALTTLLIIVTMPATVDDTLVRLLVRAHAIRARLLQDPSLTLREIAAEEGIVSSYVSRLIRLSFLAPDMVTAIFNGRHPAGSPRTG